MRKTLLIAVATGLLAASLAGPALAGKKAKPVATTLYFHGTETVGELESYPFIAAGYFAMDSTEPTGAQPKSKQLTNYVGGPNTECAGNEFFPVWIGDVSGTVKGDVKVTFNTIAVGGAVDVRIWPDVAGQLCTNETLGVFDYPEPAGEVRVSLPPGAGTVEAVIEGVKFKATSLLMVQLTPVITPPFFGRVLYDSPTAASKIEFSCTPAKGQKACTP
jgi:hypothetical protein